MLNFFLRVGTVLELRQLWRWQWLLLPLLPLWAYRIGQEELGRRHLGVGADSSINKPITNSPVNTETPPYITNLLELPARRMMGRLPDGVPEVDLVGLQRPDVVLDQLAGAVLLEVVR